MIKTTVGIEGMSCGMCEAHINDVVRREFKVKSVKSSVKKKNSEIVSKEPIDEEKLRKAITDTGYTVTGITSEEYVKKGLFR
ncbi:MAG: cation transporter [Oscillospiraceae bacterium]|nr:cation transporter [Oscillospiraceae bacterium]MDD6356095.1 cation transporter [Oscillospiraceae bacterium]